MYSQQVSSILNILMLVEAICVILAGYVAYYIRWVIGDYVWSIPTAEFIGTVLFLMFVNNFLLGRMGLYSDKSPPSFLHEVQKIFLVTFLDFALLSIAYFLLKLDVSRLFIGIYAAALFILLLIVRSLVELLLQSRQRDGYQARRILLVGCNGRAGRILQALQKQRSWGHQVLGCIKPEPEDSVQLEQVPCLGSLDQIENILQENAVDEVICALPGNKRNVDFQAVMRICQKMGVAYRIVPALYDPEQEQPINVEKIQDVPTLTVNADSINPSGLLYKRILDFAGGLTGCLILLLLLPWVALAIKLDSRGPVFFKQKRLGQHGRQFSLYKFRTMYEDAEQRKQQLMAQNAMQGQMFKLEHDPRITRVGRLLRKTSLDEVPQFINVLLGQMSLVGTRPPTPDEVQAYSRWHRRRISIKPGITGLWQISGRNKITDFNEVVKLDLQYIDHWRFWHDLEIILKTVWVVLSRKGAF